MIVRNRMVLERSSNVPGLYLEIVPDGKVTFSLMVGEQLQRTLGNPEHITVTVEAGMPRT